MRSGRTLHSCLRGELKKRKLKTLARQNLLGNAPGVRVIFYSRSAGHYSRISGCLR